ARVKDFTGASSTLGNYVPNLPDKCTLGGDPTGLGKLEFYLQSIAKQEKIQGATYQLKTGYASAFNDVKRLADYLEKNFKNTGDKTQATRMLLQGVPGAAPGSSLYKATSDLVDSLYGLEWR